MTQVTVSDRAATINVFDVLLAAPLRVPVIHLASPPRSVTVHLDRIAQQGKVIMTYCTNDEETVAAELLANSAALAPRKTDVTAEQLAQELVAGGSRAVTLFDHYAENKTPLEAAQFRSNCMLYAFRHSEGAYVAAKRMARDAYLARDWQYVLDAGQWTAGETITAFRRWLEFAIPEPTDPDASTELRDDWIERLGVEITVLIGPLARRPLDAKKDKAVFTEVRAFLDKRGNHKGVARVDALVAAGGMDDSVFNNKGRTRRASEIVAPLRDLDLKKKQDRTTLQQLALVAAAGTQNDLRAWKREEHLGDTARNARYSTTPYFVVEVAPAGVIIAEYHEITLRFPPEAEYLLKYITDHLSTHFTFEMLETTRREVIEQG